MSQPTMQEFRLTDLKNRTDKCVIVGLCSRPGSQLFMTKLEYEHYPPRTPANANFELAMAKWEDMLFNIIMIPIEDADFAHKVATDLGMRIVPDTTMHLFTGEAAKEFPVYGEHIFMLEGGYEGDEKAAIDVIFEADSDARHNFIRANLTLAFAPRKYLDGWTETLGMYPLLHEHLVKTNADLQECIVAVIESEPYGFATICKNENGPYLGMIWVEEHSRQVGIADFLFKAVVNYSVDHDLIKLKVESRSYFFDKILAHLPEAFGEILEITKLNHDLSVEQQKVGPRYARH